MIMPMEGDLTNPHLYNYTFEKAFESVAYRGNYVLLERCGYVGRC